MRGTSIFKRMEVLQDDSFSYKFVNEDGFLCLRQINKSSEGILFRGSTNLTFNFSIKVANLFNEYLDIERNSPPDLNISFTIAKCGFGQFFQDISLTCFDCPVNFYSFEKNFQESTSCSPCSGEPFYCYGGFNLSPKPGYWRAGESSRNFLKCALYGNIYIALHGKIRFIN
jgi:hypothetical protein